MKNLNLSGCGTALVTPFRDGEVDYAAFSALVDRQIAAGIHFLVPLGTTGETPCLSDEERIRLLEITVEKCGGRPVVVGGGTNSLVQTVRSIRLLEPYGADAFLIVVPYYNKPTQEGIYEYFKAVADAAGKPVVMYNVPSRTGVNMTAETALRQTLSLMATGAAGVISVASNIAPGMMVEMVEAMQDNDLPKARALHHRLSPLFRNCFVESNPVPVKAGLAAMGLAMEEYRLPLVPGTRKTYELMRKTVEDLGLL